MSGLAMVDALCDLLTTGEAIGQHISSGPAARTAGRRTRSPSA